jgi:hypothetical protein
MALKFFVDKIEDVEEALRVYYKEVEGEGGVKRWQLDVDGGVPRASLDEFRNNNVTLRQQNEQLTKDLQAYRALEPDPAKPDVQKFADEVRELRKVRKRVQDKDLVDKEGFDDALKQRTAEMRNEYDGKIAALTDRAEKAERDAKEAKERFDASIIDRAIQDAALQNGVLPEAVADTLFRARQWGWQLNDKGQVIAKAPNGDIRYGSDGTTPLSPKDWVTGTLKQEAKHLFKGNSGGGASGGGTTDRTATDYNPWADKTINFSDQGRILREDPERAAFLARSAGKTVDGKPIRGKAA